MKEINEEKERASELLGLFIFFFLFLLLKNALLGIFSSEEKRYKFYFFLI
jgi:hypothetical protein